MSFDCMSALNCRPRGKITQTGERLFLRRSGVGVTEREGVCAVCRQTIAPGGQ